MDNAKNSLLKPTIQITVLSLVGIIVNFVTQLVIAYYFGATFERDAYFAASVIPTYIVAIFTGSIVAIFLPIYIDIKINKGKEEANSYIHNVLNFCLLLSILITLFCIFCAKNIIEITAPGFSDNNQIILVVNLLTILTISIVPQFISLILLSVLQAQSRFLLAALIPVISAIISLLVVFSFSSYIGILSLAYGTLSGALLTTSFIFYKLNHATHYKWTINFKDEYLQLLLRNSAPLFFAGFFYRMTSVFERGLASTLPRGSISYLGYANQILLILATITSSGIATTLYPKLSTAWSEKNIEQIRILLTKSIRFIFIISFPIAFIFIFGGKNIIQLVFERGAFTNETTLAVSKVFSILTIAFIATSLGNMIAKILYFSGKTIWASATNIIETSIYLFLAFSLIKIMSYEGLAWAYSLSTFLSVSISFGMVCIILKQIKIKALLIDSFKIFTSAFIPSLALLLIKDSTVIMLIYIIALYPILYYIMAILLKVEETQLIINLIKNKYGRKCNL